MAEQEQSSRPKEDVVPQSSRAPEGETSINKDKPKQKGVSIEEARSVVAELKEQNERKQALLDREEAMKVESLLEGESEAGVQEQKLSPEEERKLRVNEMLKETGLSI